MSEVAPKSEVAPVDGSSVYHFADDTNLLNINNSLKKNSKARKPRFEIYLQMATCKQNIIKLLQD